MPQDEEFIKKLRATFKVEAEEHLQTISSILMELEKSPSPQAQTASVETVYREAHSLKGAARAVDLSEIETICQKLETTFAAWKRQPLTASPEIFDMLHRSLDSIREILVSPQREKSADCIRDQKYVVQAVSDLPMDTRTATSSNSTDAESPVAAVSPAVSVAHMLPETEKGTIAETLRITSTKLDALLLQAEDLLVLKAAAAQQNADLRHLTTLFDQWRKQWAKIAPEMRTSRQINSRQKSTDVTGGVSNSTALADFLDWNCEFVRSQQNKLVSLLARTEQDTHSMAKRVDDLLEESKKLLMLPFASMADMLPKLVRDLCRDQGKQADLSIRGGEVEIDKRILEEMKDAMIHLLRNSVDHGVESPSERARLHKPPRAVITIAVSQMDGNKVEIIVSDDGAGIDLRRVKDSAVEHGILSGAQAGTISESEALALVFHSEVSTRAVVTAISGRGLGMAIVRAKAEKLGGRVSVESQAGVGTTLRITLPLTLATFRGLLVTAADRTYVIPSMNVERLIRIKPEDIRTVENREVISFQGKAISLAHLDAVLELNSKRRPVDGAALQSIVIIHFGQERIAFKVDDVLFEEAVLVKPLRKPLTRVRNIAGATILGSGKAVPVLNIADLMKSAKKGAVLTAGPTAQVPQKPQVQKILVVEDSITSRMLLKNILESAAYEVKTAVDGLDAFTALRENRFDLVVSDVEMPRMNGFDLAVRIRADKRLANLPIILVTALESRLERERGIDAGANAYLIKSSFDQSDLLTTIRRLI